MPTHGSWTQPRWIFLAGGLLLPACGAPPAEPLPKPAGPLVKIDQPKQGQSYKAGETIVIHGRVEVASGQWSPTLMRVALTDQKDKLTEYGSRSITADFSKSPGSLDFETSFPAPNHACKVKLLIEAVRSVDDGRGGSTFESKDTSFIIEVTR